MTIQAIIFDRDGVLVDFDYIAATTFFEPLVPFSLWEMSARSHQWGLEKGFPRSAAEEKVFFREFWDEICDEFNLSQKTRQKLHQFDYTSIFYPYPDARPALLEARQRGLKIGVLSNFTLASIDASLEATNLADLVDMAFAATIIGHSKPDPEAYLTVTRALSVSPENTLLFDNKRQHVEGGRVVGIRSYLVDRSRADHDLQQGIVQDLSALPEILAQLQR